MDKHIAVITGASSGMGADFARQLASSGYDELWLVARRRDRLEALAHELSTTACVIIEADLETEAGVGAVRARLEAEAPRIGLYVNAAGFGSLGPFADTARATLAGQVSVNVRALTLLTYDALPFMAQGSTMLLVGSLASFTPVSEMAVYGATKAYVLSLASALSVELAARQVFVTVLCPGPVRTGFFEAAHMNGDKFWAQGILESAVVVRRTLRAVSRRRHVVVPSLLWRLLVVAMHFAPRRLKARLSGQTMK